LTQDTARSEQPQFLQGLELFNRREFYDCHDLIEDLWLQESSDQQPFLQGIIQAAVAFFHYQQGKWGAARTMMQQSIERLAPYPGSHGGIDLERFRSELRVWKEALDEAISRGSRAPLALDYPMINLRSE
jgi:predicted metal-dependent hydrolase